MPRRRRPRMQAVTHSKSCRRCLLRHPLRCLGTPTSRPSIMRIRRCFLAWRRATLWTGRARLSWGSSVQLCGSTRRIAMGLGMWIVRRTGQKGWARRRHPKIDGGTFGVIRAEQVSIVYYNVSHLFEYLANCISRCILFFMALTTFVIAEKTRYCKVYSEHISTHFSSATSH